MASPRGGGVTVRDSGDLRRIAKELKAMNDKELKKKLSKELRAAARPLVPVTRKAIRAIPSSRSYSAAGLRGRMSKAVRTEVKTSGKQAGVRIRVDGRKMPAKQGALPAYMEGSKKPWRHPVYGNREVWVVQTAKPYFYKTLRPKAGPAARKAVNRVITDVSKQII
jgi:hypothetical protein